MKGIARTVGSAIRMVVLMGVCGMAGHLVSVYFLMYVGLKYHNNYEYYGNFPLLYLGPALIGFLAPAAIAWLRQRRARGHS